MAINVLVSQMKKYTNTLSKTYLSIQVQQIKCIDTNLNFYF